MTPQEHDDPKVSHAPTKNGEPMPESDLLLERNEVFASSGAFRDMPMKPNLNVVVIGCLDPRIEPANVLGLELGDAPVLRNAGGRATPGVINDLALIGFAASQGPGPGPDFEIIVLHHTQCGSSALANDDLRARYAALIESDDDAELRYLAVVDPEETVRADVARIRAATSIPDTVSISGYVYDVTTGVVKTIVPAAPKAPQPEA